MSVGASVMKLKTYIDTFMKVSRFIIIPNMVYLYFLLSIFPTNPKLSHFEKDDSSDVIYVSGKKKGRGEENLFKRDGRKGKRFSSPLP